MYQHKAGCIYRKIARKDLPRLLELKQESWWGTHKSLIINSEDQERWFETIPNDSLYVIAEWNGQPIGVAAYTNIDHQNKFLCISGSVFKEHRQLEKIKAAFAGGLDFAFEMFPIDRVEAQVLEWNVPAQQLEINFLGFKVEGRRRKAVFKCGRHYDSILLGMLREEWLSHPRVKALGDTCNVNFSHDRMMKLAERFSQDNDGVLASLLLVGESSLAHQS